MNVKSPKMQKIITDIANKHNVNLAEAEWGEVWIQLEMPGFMNLTIEKLWPDIVSVTHYFEQNGDLVRDVQFCISCGDTWIPVDITQVLGGWRQLAQVTQHDNDTGVVLERLVSEATHQEVAQFADWWAQNIIDQGWLEHGVNTAH